MNSIPQPIQLTLPFEGKVCTRCQTWKPLTEFGREHAGHLARCKVCYNAACRAYNAQHLEAARARRRKWSEAHPEKQRAAIARWNERNRTRRKARLKAWWDAHPDYYAEWKERNRAKWKEYHFHHQRAYRKRHPNYCKLAQHRRRARIKLSGGVITHAEWEAMKAHYNYTCLCCGRREPDIKLTLDHVIPIVAGGPNVISNAQPLCGTCNSTKGRTIKDYRPSLL